MSAAGERGLSQVHLHRLCRASWNPQGPTRMSGPEGLGLAGVEGSE